MNRTTWGLLAVLLLAQGSTPPVAAAQSVETDFDTVTAIRDLELNGVIYDVEFLDETPADVYGTNPPIFDFDTAEKAAAAVDAVVGTLNAEGGAFKVGPSEESGATSFQIAFDELEVLGNQTAVTWGGATSGTEATGVWVASPRRNRSPFVQSGSFADFVVVDSTGSGNQPPVAETDGPYEGRDNVELSFDGSASRDPDGSITTHIWDFGDGTSLGGMQVKHTYASAGIYLVTLTVTDDEGASRSTTTTADIGDGSIRPTADVGGPYSGVEGQSLVLSGAGSTDVDGDIVQYDWDFGDGVKVSSNIPELQHTYDEGTYRLVLTVTDDTGNTDIDLAAVFIGDGNLPPKADAGPPVSALAGDSVDFDGSGSSDPDDDISSYDWDFGDGNSGTGESPSHTYDDPGSYRVRLTVTDAAGATDSSITAADITDDNLPPTADANGPYTGTVNVDVDFDGSGSSDDSGIFAYLWDFGDDATALGETPSHPYTEPGNYVATLLVIDDDGALSAADFATVSIDAENVPPEADAGDEVSGVVGGEVIFDGSGSSDPDGELRSMAWVFGDGETGSGPMPSHVYDEAGTYDVYLTVFDDQGDYSRSKTRAVIAMGNQLPTAEANGPYTGIVGSPVDFSSEGSTDPDGDIASWEWEFGDDTSSTEENPSKAYAAAGFYIVTLTVTDDGGETRSDSTTAEIGTDNVAPVADAGGPYVGTVDQMVAFDASASTDSDGTIVSWDWDFGDGDSGSGETASHAYTATDTYVVKLTVTDEDGGTDIDTVEVPVGVGNQAPVADAGGPYADFGDKIVFDGTGSSDPEGGALASYLWDFGDGTTKSGATKKHQYEERGVYFVTLTVTDEDGTTDSAGTLVLDDVDRDGVRNKKDKDNDNDGILDKEDVDKDGDGWDVHIENKAGTSDLVRLSVPEEGPIGRGPGVTSLLVKVNFKKVSQDKVELTGTVPVPEGFERGGQNVVFDFGDGAVVLTYTLDEKGKFSDDVTELSFSKKKLLDPSGTYVSKFSLSVKKQDFQSGFPQFVNKNTKESVDFSFSMTVGDEEFNNRKLLKYTGTKNKNGQAEQKKP